MRITLYIFAISFILFGCNNNNRKSRVTLEPTTDSLYIKLGKRELNQSNHIQYFTENDSNYLAVLNDKIHSIFIYNLNNQKLVKKIRIEKEGINAFPDFSSFTIKNMDTIIYISAVPGSIGIATGNGEITNRVSLQKDENGKMCYTSFSLIGTKGILVDNIFYLAQAMYIPGYKKHLNSAQLNQLDLGITVNLENNKVRSVPLHLPKDFLRKDISSAYYSRVLGYDNCFVYMFSNSNNLYITKGYSEFEKIPIETNYDLKLPKKLSKYEDDLNGFISYHGKKDGLQNIHYDKYRECYYLLVRKRLKDTKQNRTSKASMRPDFFIIILDKDFKFLGDMNFPENTYSLNNLFITKEGVYISEDHFENPTFSEDAMRFRLFKLKEISDEK